jgi:diguanylate cyclase (GGDEF)-like protein
MWILTIRSPSNEPLDYPIKSGKNTIGRKLDNDIVINDESASRNHAEIYCQDDQIVIQDLNSLNGTHVNRERIQKPTVLKHEDQIRIGQHVGNISHKSTDKFNNLIETLSGTRPLTRELLLESIDKYSILLLEVSSRLSSTLDLASALKEISVLLRIFLGADHCEVILAEHFDQLPEMGFLNSIARQAIRECSVVSIADVSSQEILGVSESQTNISSVFCVPVMLEKEVAGIIYVYKTDSTKRAFDQNDIQLAVAISHQAALAIQRARLMDYSRELEQLATTDSLTGLFNRSQFLKMAELEFERAQRFKHPLAMLMFDVDNFKMVNDTYGHRAGDQVLKTVAGRCLEQLRGIDIISRFGGDEFMVLLPETNIEGAKTVAGRLSRCITNLPVYTDQGKMDITISLGIALLSEDCPDLATLLLRADEALYAAKKAGKNQTSF